MKRRGRASGSPPMVVPRSLHEPASRAVRDPLAEVVQPAGVAAPHAAPVPHPLDLVGEAVPLGVPRTAAVRATASAASTSDTQSNFIRCSVRGSSAGEPRQGQVRLQRVGDVRRAQGQLADAGSRSAERRGTGRPGRPRGARPSSRRGGRGRDRAVSRREAGRPGRTRSEAPAAPGPLRLRPRRGTGHGGEGIGRRAGPYPVR